MPIFQLDTNVGKNKITKEFLKSTAQLISKILEKPLDRVVVHVQADQQIIIGESDELCGIASLKAIGKFGIVENKKYTESISEYLNKTLGISPNRLRIDFIDVKPSQIGSHNSTLHFLLNASSQ